MARYINNSNLTQRRARKIAAATLITINPSSFSRIPLLAISPSRFVRTHFVLRLEKARDVLRREVDLLIVPARNPSSQLPSQLKTMAANEGLIVAYCNGLMVGRGNGD